jgi:hypothetical protein
MTGVAFRQLFKATGTTLGCSTTANGITRIAMIVLNVCRHGRCTSWAQTILSRASGQGLLVGGCKILSLAQRFAYDHSSSTKYSSLYTLVDYAAERVDAVAVVSCQVCIMT